MAGEKIVTMVIGKDDDDVGFFRSQRCANENWQKKAEHDTRVGYYCDHCNSEWAKTRGKTRLVFWTSGR